MKTDRWLEWQPGRHVHTGIAPQREAMIPCARRAFSAEAQPAVGSGDRGATSDGGVTTKQQGPGGLKHTPAGSADQGK